MRLQELKTKEAKQLGEATVKTVRVFLQNTFYNLDGTWHWEMETDAVFCSDVMVQSPDNFFGTKAIFHPDDLPAVKRSLCTDEPVESLGFRIIATYGEVKQVTGEAVTVQLEEQTAEDLQKQVIEAVIAEQERKAAAKHGELVKDLADKNSRFAGLGNWYFNAATGQTWYANAVFTLHGLPPQSLNAHLHTFHPFIHPEDVVLVTDFLDKAFQERSPLQMDYRILAGETEKWISYKSDWFFNTQGEAILGGTYQDVTDQKNTELELESFKNLVHWQRQQIQFDEQQANFGHWQVNLLTRKTIYSDQYYRIFGLKPQSLSATLGTFLNYIHPEDRGEVEAAYKKMIYEHTASELEYRVVRLDGKMRYVQQRARLLLYEGEMVISGLIQDVTVQRMLEIKLARVQEENWVQGQVAEQASEMASLISWSVDLEDGSITWSESFYRFLGFSKTTPPNVSEKSLFSIIHPQDVKLFKEHWTRAVREKQPATFEFRSMQRGSIYHMTAVFSLQERGEKTWFIGTVEDITGEQVLQHKLAQRVQLAESLTNNIPDRVIITDTSNTVLVWNPAAEKAYGVKKSDAVGENFFDLFPALKTEEEMQLFHRVHRGEKVVVENAVSVTGNGFYNLHLLPLYTGEEVSGILHIVRNVTSETELRQHLNDRLHLIESLVQSSVDRIIALDARMNYLYWNKQAEEYYGLTKEEVLGKNILEVFPQMVNDPSYQQLRKALKGETIHIPIDPSRHKYFETYLIPIKGQDGSVVSLLWTAHDLSHEWQLQEEQRKSQARLQEEHRRLKEAQAIGHVGSFEWKVGSSIAYWSDELYRINGLEPQSEEITLDKVDQFIHPDDFAELQRLKEASLLRPGKYKMIHRIELRTGEVRWVAHEWESIANEEGEVARVTGVVQDITERKNAEEELIASQGLLQATMDASLDMIQVFEAVRDKNGEIVDFRYVLINHEAEKWMPEAIGKSLLDRQPGVVQEGIFDAFKQVVETGIPQQYEKHYVHEQFDGWFYQSVVKMGDGVATTTTDITARKEAEAQILQLKDAIAQKATDKYLALFNSIDEAVAWMEMITDEAGNPVDYRLLEANPAYSNMSGGLTVEDSVGKTAKELIPNVEQWWIDTVAKVAFGGESIRMEQHVKDLDSWFQVYVSPVGDKRDGQFVAVYTDITKRKQQEEKQAYLLKLIDATRSQSNPDEILNKALKTVAEYLDLDRIGYNEIDPDVTEYWYRACYVREGFAPVLGRFPMDPFKETVRNLQKGITFIANDAFDESFSEAEKEVHRIVNVGAYVTVPLVKNGRWVCNLVAHYSQPRTWTEHEVSILEETAERIWASVERAKVEDALQQSEEEFRLLVTATSNSVYKMSADWKLMYNLEGKDFLADTGSSESSWLEKYIPAHERQKVTDAIEKAIRNKTNFELEHQVFDAAGNIAWVHSRAVPKLDEKGEIMEWIGAGSNITPRKQAEEQLRDFALQLEQQVEERTENLKQSTEELQKNVAILKQAEDIAAIGSWEYQIPSGRFSWSDGMYRIFDYPMGAPVQPEIYLDRAAEGDRITARRIVKNLRRTQQAFEEHLRIQTANGIRHLKVKGTVVADEEGKAQRIVGVDIDMTDVVKATEQLQQSQRWLEETAKASPDAITIYDLNKKQPVYLNNCLAEWTGKSLDELVSMGIEGRLKLIHRDDRLNLLHFNEKMAMAKDDDVLNIEYRIFTKDDDLRWVRNRSKVFQRDANGKVTHILSILQDVSEEKAAERLLKDLNASLERQNRELEAKNDEITSFAFVASHDLKEPIRKIHTFSDWLMQRETGLTEPGRQNLVRLHNSVKRLDTLVDDIVALTKVHVDKEDLREVSLNAVLQRVKQEMQETIEQSGAEIISDHLPLIKGVENHLVYLFKNLFGNSIKFQEPGNKPVIRIKATQIDTLLRLTVTDNGIGFAPEYSKKIFQMFRRLHGKTDFEGTGMGLAICKRIMEKHGGNITAESEEGKGATFTCWFPV